jgi:hypothetical protein
MGMMLKSIPNEILIHLLSDEYNILLFGLPDELKDIVPSA